MAIGVLQNGGHGQQPLECIDMASPDKLTHAARIREACLSAGFFYIINHGVDPNFLEEVFAQSKKFFALPSEEKMKLFRDKNQRGYTPFEEDMLNPGYQSKGETKEGYYIGLSMESDLPLYGPNQYPSSDLLPGWRGTMDRYFQEMTGAMDLRIFVRESQAGPRKLSKSLAPLIALALNLEESFFEQQGVLDNTTSTMRLLHYSTERSVIEDGVFAAGAHSDWGFLTLLATDDVPGLQICRNKDAVPQVWEDVPPMIGAYIVNLGQLLERWSNGLFRATLHRVIGKGVDRYSIPFFFEPNYDCIVECLPTCCSEDNPPKYPPVRSGDHIVSLYKQTHKNAFLAIQ